jgi:hypothetical protein
MKKSKKSDNKKATSKKAASKKPANKKVVSEKQLKKEVHTALLNQLNDVIDCYRSMPSDEMSLFMAGSINMIVSMAEFTETQFEKGVDWPNTEAAKLAAYLLDYINKHAVMYNVDELMNAAEQIANADDTDDVEETDEGYLDLDAEGDEEK